MIVGVDARIPWATGRGWGRYTRELIAELAATPDLQLRVLLPESAREASWTAQLFDTATARAAFAPFDEVSPDGYVAAAGDMSIERQFNDLDVVHSPTRFVLPTEVRPLVATIHDIAPLSEPPFKPLYRAATLAALEFLRQERVELIAVSAFTSDELARYAGFDPEDVAVIHHGISDVFRPVPAVRRENFILYVGGAGANKNLDRAIAAISDLRQTHNIDLVMAGDSSRDEDELRRVLGPAQPRWIHLRGYVSDADLADLYRRARLCVMPSLHEGFGLPVLEAMACGTPLACSALPVFNEVASDAAVYFDATDVAAMLATIRHVLDNEAFANELVTKGCVRAQRFTWEEAARQTVGVYRRAMTRARRQPTASGTTSTRR